MVRQRVLNLFSLKIQDLTPKLITKYFKPPNNDHIYLQTFLSNLMMVLPLFGTFKWFYSGSDLSVLYTKCVHSLFANVATILGWGFVRCEA